MCHPRCGGGPVSPDVVPYRPDCGECGRLKADGEAARTARDASGEVDFRVVAWRHLRKVHGGGVGGGMSAVRRMESPFWQGAVNGDGGGCPAGRAGFVRSFTPERCQVGRMRREGAAFLRGRGLDACVDTVSLLISELLTNAVVHGDGASGIELRVWHAGGEVLIVVDDHSPGRPVLRHPGPEEEGGRGVLLVAELATRWGSNADGSRTWCTVAVRDGGPR